MENHLNHSQNSVYADRIQAQTLLDFRNN